MSSESRSTEEISEAVMQRSNAIRAGRYPTSDDSRYLLELLYEDVADFMENVVTWMRTREELERTGGRLG